MNTSSVNITSSPHPNAYSRNSNSVKNNADLSDAQRRQIEKLATRDQEVRTHEQAHLSAAGAYATSSASFSYQTGPDGKRYAIGGEVLIDTSTIPNNPAASLRKAEIIRRAALAPAHPSDQDRAVAQSASSMITKAQIELIQQTDTSNTKGKSGSNFHYSV